MSIRGVVGFTVEDDQRNRWWFRHLGNAEQFYDSLLGTTRLHDSGHEIKEGCWAHLIAWDKHPSHDGAIGLLIREVEPS